MTAAGGSTPPAAAMVRRLMDLGLLSAAQAVDDGFLIVDSSVSHQAFRVAVGGVERFFAKQADPVRSLGRDLKVEASFYRLAREAPELSGIVPHCWLVTDDDELLVLDAVGGSLYSPGTGPEDRPRTDAVLRQYGSALARVHTVVPPPMAQPPWLLNAFEQAASGYGWLPEPCRALLLRLAGSAAFRQGFRRARDDWSESALVHGDLRWANVLVATQAPRPRVWLVDWELACLGDPAWDIGSVLADFLAAEPTAPRAGAAPSVHAHSRTFLTAYRREARPTPDVWLELLRRSVRLAGVRLIQTLVEYGHAGAAHLRAVEPTLLPWAAALLEDEPALLAALAEKAVPARPSTAAGSGGAE